MGKVRQVKDICLVKSDILVSVQHGLHEFDSPICKDYPGIIITSSLFYFQNYSINLPGKLKEP